MAVVPRDCAVSKAHRDELDDLEAAKMEHTVMSRHIVLGLASVATWIGAARATGAQQATSRAAASPIPRLGMANAPLVLSGVTVVDIEHGERRRDQRVVIVGNRIRALGSARGVPIPAGARVVDARGKYLIPGLWDMHIHPAMGWPTPAVQAHLAAAVYRQLLAAGVTGIRDAGSPIPLDTFRVWKREIAEGQRVGPRLIVSGPSIFDTVDGCTRATRRTCSRSGWAHATYVADPADARQLVDSLQAAGADILKTYDLSAPTYFALAAEARRIGIPFGGHVTWGNATTNEGLIASDSGARILDHELYAGVCGAVGDSVLSLTQCRVAAGRMRRNQTWMTPWASLVVPTPPLPDSFQARAVRYDLPHNLFDAPATNWRPLTAAGRQRLPTGADWAAVWTTTLADSAASFRGCQAARLAYAADLPWMPGTDWHWGPPPGVGVHLALLYPVLCGVPPRWVLQAATLEPARAFHLTDSLGTVAVGKVADLVLLEGDPLEDVWNVSKTWSVVANGRYYDRAALDHLLVEAVQEWSQVRALMRQVEETQAKATKGKP